MNHTKESLLVQLEQLGVPQDRIVMVHSALRTVGKLEEGGQTLLDALIEYVTQKGGLLCIPTHTWHHLDNGQQPTLDMASDDTCLGVLAALAIRDPRGIRSESPTHSVVVFGQREKALELIREESVAITPTAPCTCYGALYKQNGYVLLIGVGQNKNTYLHAVDEILNTPNRMGTEKIPVTVKKADGSSYSREICLFYTDYIDDISLRFWKYEPAFRYCRCITDGFLGDAPVQLCDARGMKETVAEIFQRSGGEDPLEGEEQIPPLWYCK